MSNLAHLKKWSRFLLVLSLLIAICLIYFWLMNPRAFPIKKIRVQADYAHVNPALIQKIVTPYVKSSLFGLSASSLQSALKQVPWIGQVNIRRKFPATVVITITEQQPILVWNQTGLMTAQGTLFQPDPATIPANLPSLSGPKGTESEVFSTMQQINQVLQPLNLQVQDLSLSSRGAWSLQLSNGIEVIIGQDNIWPRLQQFVAVYPKIIGSKADQALRIDLRYPNGFAVLWKQKRR